MKRYSGMRRKLLILFLCAVAVSIAALLFYQSHFFRFQLYNRYPDVSYYYITDEIAGRGKDVMERCEKLNSYVHENIFTPPVEVQDLPPLDNLFRGVGWCDQSAHLFIRLLEQLGVKGYLIFLHTNKDGSGPSPHSIAVFTPAIRTALDTDGIVKSGIVADTLQGVIFKNSSGGYASFADICAGNVSNDQKTYFSEVPAFRRGLYCNKPQVFLENSPIGATGRRGGIFYRHILPRLPKVFFHIYQDLVLELWYRRGFTSNKEFLYYKARHYHAYQRFEDALRLYRQVLDDPQEEALRPESLFFSANIYLKTGRHDQARACLDELFSRYPSSPWSSVAAKIMVAIPAL